MRTVTEFRLDFSSNLLGMTFDDGLEVEMSAEILRVESPSAEVQGHGPGQRKLVAGKRFVEVEAIEPVGNYAVRLHFSDGHSSGIYSYDYLYDLADNLSVRFKAYRNALKEAGLSRDP